MRACLKGLSPLSLLPSQATNPLKGHLSISMFAKGLINGLANPALNAEPHHTNLITQKRAHTDLNILPSFAPHSRRRRHKNGQQIWIMFGKKRRKAEQRKKPWNQKAACHE